MQKIPKCKNILNFQKVVTVVFGLCLPHICILGASIEKAIALDRNHGKNAIWLQRVRPRPVSSAMVNSTMMIFFLLAIVFSMTNLV